MTKENKRRKVEDPSQDSIRCEFFLAKKNRQCGMQRKAGNRYCSEHMVAEGEAAATKDKGERVPCPLDPNHSVWEKDLRRHLKKCNAKPKEIHDPWYEQDLNLGLKTEEKQDKDQNDKKETKIRDTEEKNDDKNDESSGEGPESRCYDLLEHTDFEPLQLEKSQHSGLNNRISELKNPKHALQQSSLIGNLRDRSLLNPSTFYIEFGCGKAELSRFVNLCVIDDMKEKTMEKGKYGFGLVDRGLNRMKMDTKIPKDISAAGIELNPTVKRTRIDIKDLDLDAFLQDVDPDSVVGISKHLCGVATDLTLTSLLNSQLLGAKKFGGILIAMCCRHVCSYEQLLPESKEYLREKGFGDSKSFGILKKAVSWAVCGTGRSKNESTSGSGESEKFTQEHKEKLGLVARRLIDESRAHAVRKRFAGYKVELFHYIDRDVTLENVCLCIRRT